MHCPVAFRCKNCGHLTPAEHAGESTIPHACVVCGKGVKWTENGIKTAQPENWEVLSECTPARLKELGLEPDHVCKHVPAKASPNPSTPQNLTREANDGVTATVKQG